MTDPINGFASGTVAAPGAPNGNHLGELAAALAKAQAAFPKVLKDRTAKITGGRAEYSYKYADLASLLEAVRPSLAANGLALTQPIEITDKGMVLHTMLLHTSGAHLDSYYPLAAHERPQEMGSEITYSRRYTAGSILGIASEEDDDGAAAQNAPKRAQEPRGAPVAAADDVPFDYVPPAAEAAVLARFASGDLTCPACTTPRKVKPYKNGTGWYCQQYGGGCGGSWKVAAPAAPTTASGKPIDTATGEVKADPEVIAMERKALVLKASKLAKAIDLDPQAKRDAWATYIGDNVSEVAADPAALQDLIKWLETRAANKGVAVA